MLSAIARVHVTYNGADYRFDYPHPYEDKDSDELEGGMYYHWVEGNYSCDCNLIPFIEGYCDTEVTPLGWDEIPCGHDVTLVSLDAVYNDGRVVNLYPGQRAILALDPGSPDWNAVVLNQSFAGKIIFEQSQSAWEKLSIMEMYQAIRNRNLRGPLP